MKAGFIGTGNIGAPMAARLMSGGHDLVVCDLRPAAVEPLLAAGARAAASPREVADQTAVLFLSLPSQQAFRAASLGPDGCIHGKAARIIVNTSTLGMPFVQEMAKAFASRDMILVDCPISGGVVGTRAGTLSIMVSGDPGAIETIRPLISCWGHTITIAGSQPGAAQVLKLTNNILSIVALAATAEAFVMGAKAGLDPETMLAAINAGSGRNSATESKFPVAVLNRSFEYGSAIRILMKDADLAIEQGEALGIPMWVCQAARLVYKYAMFEGAADHDVTTIVQHIERAAGFEIPKTR
jgi:3-hydroxyisobutyrate dehydrogenase-like beta-hydroxyacid dehydrogenase